MACDVTILITVNNQMSLGHELWLWTTASKHTDTLIVDTVELAHDWSFHQCK